MTYTDIEAVLSEHLSDTLSDLSPIPRLHTENTLVTPKVTETYVRSTISPAASTRLSSHTDLLAGVFLIDVLVPLHKGADSARTIVDAIVDAFPRALVLASQSNPPVHIVRTYPGIGFPNTTHYIIPVTVEWVAEKAKE